MKPAMAMDARLTPAEVAFGAKASTWVRQQAAQIRSSEDSEAPLDDQQLLLRLLRRRWSAQVGAKKHGNAFAPLRCDVCSKASVAQTEGGKVDGAARMMWTTQQCAHTVCAGCMAAGVTGAAEAGASKNGVGCPVVGCTATLLHAELKSCLDEAAFAAHESACLNEYLEGDVLGRCPTCQTVRAPR